MPIESLPTTFRQLYSDGVFDGQDVSTLEAKLAKLKEAVALFNGLDEAPPAEELAAIVGMITKLAGISMDDPDGFCARYRDDFPGLQARLGQIVNGSIRSLTRKVRAAADNETKSAGVGPPPGNLADADAYVARVSTAAGNASMLHVFANKLDDAFNK